MHVIQRGNNRSACFRDAGDYGLYLGLLNELSPTFECAVHAYVLMTNHVHLLMTPAKPEGVSDLMKHLGQRYVQHFNRRNARTGSLWEGRFRSSIVDSGSYLFQCQRYIELNPVRARMVAHPLQYPWSSYATNAGFAMSTFLVPHDQYVALGETPDVRCARYRELFDEEITAQQLYQIRAAARGGFALGPAAFITAVGRTLRRRAGPGSSGRPRTRAAQTEVPPGGKPWSVPGFEL